MAKHYDVIIIGSGAGGSTLAYSLAPTGKRILILERGAIVPIEADNWNSKAVFVDKKYQTRERWLDDSGRPFNPHTHYWAGGNTTFYGAALMRMKPRDFEMTMHHGGGISPAWPLDYADFAPYYAKAEAMWEVHGTRHIDPTDAPDDPPLPFPAIQHDPGVAALKAHFEAIGWHPSPLPLGVRRIEGVGNDSPCIKCHTCGGYPCMRLAKVDARTAALAKADAFDNVTLMTGRKVLRIETDASGRTATAVVTQGLMGEDHFTADIIVTAAGAVNSAALWLKSANAAHPNGLANSSDMVGRNYMFHTSSAVVGVAVDKFEADFPKTLCVMDFYHKDPDGQFDWPMGQIQMLEYMSGATIEGQLSDNIPPFLVPDLLSNALAQRMVSFLAMSEDLPQHDNRIRITSDGQIRLSYDFGDMAGHHRLVDKLRDGISGFVSGDHVIRGRHIAVDQLLPVAGTAHQCGTLRFGTDPKTSVLDVHCRAHDVDNLYAVDTSFFVSSAAVNPTLTTVANAIRVADHIAARLQ